MENTGLNGLTMAHTPPRPQFSRTTDSPPAILRAMAQQFSPVDVEEIDLTNAHGRVLAQAIQADRDQPACDVSAADGYAMRMTDVSSPHQSVVAESWIGHAAPDMPASGVVKIVTGAPVPAGADCVIRRETVEEHGDYIVQSLQSAPKPGQDIRRKGDNIRAGETVVPSGQPIHPAMMGSLASFGIGRPRVHRRVRVGMIVTGDELLPVDSHPDPWQLRESHGVAIGAMLQGIPWIGWLGYKTIADDLSQLTTTLVQLLERCDVVILTGGVSMGDRDFVPSAVKEAGARVAFHGMPMRPGRPMLGAISPHGQAIFGLPGNPLSVLVTARRLVSIVLRRLAGFSEIDPPKTMVRIKEPIAPDSRLWVYRPVTMDAAGFATCSAVKSSGDLVSAARSDGFIEVPAGSSSVFEYSFFRWSFA